MERLLMMADRLPLALMDAPRPEDLGYRVATRRLHVAIRQPVAVVLVGPAPDLLARAEGKAVDGALVVVSARPGDVDEWRGRVSPLDLSTIAPSDGAELTTEIREAIQFLVRFGGGQQMADATSRAAAVRKLRQAVADGASADPAAVERYALATGLVNHRGARRLREILEGVLRGDAFDIRGHRI